jgi:hypothetical protein
VLLLAIIFASIQEDLVEGVRPTGKSNGLEERAWQSRPLPSKGSHSKDVDGRLADGPLANGSSLAELGIGAHQIDANRKARATVTRARTGGVAMDTYKLLAGCALCAIIIGLVSRIDCGSKKLDVRRCKCMGRWLLDIGYDEFESFNIRVTVHSVQDIVGEGLLDSKTQFQAEVAFKWSKWSTSPTTDMKWEQSKALEVPQGASEGMLTLKSVGTFRNKSLGTHCFDTKIQMIEKN